MLSAKDAAAIFVALIADTAHYAMKPDTARQIAASEREFAELSYRLSVARSGYRQGKLYEWLRQLPIEGLHRA